tara:strand:- start:1068 stop:1343 length:276 start_codon:yes stop_codon:yes gene_type:complete
MTTNSDDDYGKLHTATIPFEVPLNLENYWVRETAYIVNEMLYAIRQSKNPSLTTEKRAGYTKRGRDLRDKAIMCINNAYNHSNKEENEENE